ncbi:group III truncated hemoglobin [Polaribacter sp. M15]
MTELKENFKPDVSSRKDIKKIITIFYDKLLDDKTMLPFFQEIVANNQLEQHLEIITDFWNDILFDTATYSNNVMQKHLDKNVELNFKKQHFTIWVSYFTETINSIFQGEISERMKARAQSIATIMQLKMKLYQ